MWALWTMAAAAHHNSKVQESLLQQQVLPLAFGKLSEEHSSLQVRQKALLLISGTFMPMAITFDTPPS